MYILDSVLAEFICIRIEIFQQRKVKLLWSIHQTGLIRWCFLPTGRRYTNWPNDEAIPQSVTLCDKNDTYQDKHAQTIQKCVKVNRSMNGVCCLC